MSFPFANMKTSMLISCKKSNHITRLIGTVIMLSAFIIIVKLDSVYSILLVWIIQTLILTELIAILNAKKKEHFDTRKTNWYFILVANVYFVGRTIGKLYNSKIPMFMIQHHYFFCFTAYVTGIIAFIISLERKYLKQQFSCFAIAHFLIYAVSFCSNFCVLNVLKGKIWFVYPALLVVSNDVFAYVFGKLCGRRPLLSLSPNKTWEGFIGGFISTLIIGFFLAYLKAEFGLFLDQKDSVLLSYQTFNLLKISFSIQKIYLHALSFIIFASFIAPFGGFFASGLKRAYKVKDFSSTIPGHGGFADRFDCQFLMGLFTNVYYYTFIYEKIVTKEAIHSLIKANLKSEEVLELLTMIQEDFAVS